MADDNEAVRFYESLGADFDTAEPLRWSFLLSGAVEGQIAPLMKELVGLGFNEVEPMLDEDREGRYILWFAMVGVHNADSFAGLVSQVEELAAREALAVFDFSAGRV